MVGDPTQEHCSDAEFIHAFRHHPAGVAIVTADDGSGPVAMTVSSVASVAIDPPTLVFSASSRSSSTPTIRNAETVVVHLLASDHVELAELGSRSGSERFGDRVEWGRLPTGEPYYPKANAWIRGRVTQKIDVHGSTLIIVEALETKPEDEDEDAVEPSPLVYHNRRWFILNEKSALPKAVVPFYVVYGRGDE